MGGQVIGWAVFVPPIPAILCFALLLPPRFLGWTVHSWYLQRAHVSRIAFNVFWRESAQYWPRWPVLNLGW